MTAASSARKVRRQRSVTEMLLSIVLGLEAVLVFFVMLVVYGLDALPAEGAFGGGVLLIVVLLLTGRVLRFGWGLALGWLLQVGLILTGILVPLMYVIGALFAGIWVFCFIRGRSIDHQKAAFAAAQPQGDNA